MPNNTLPQAKNADDAGNADDTTTASAAAGSASNRLDGVKVAILVDNGFEQDELTSPREALQAAGASTQLVSQQQQVRGWQRKDWGDTLPVDLPLADADAAAFDALLLPGGVMNPDALRTQPAAVAFVKAFFDADKPVAAICHGAWTVIEAGAARGRRMAAWPSLQTDLRNAGAQWLDQAVVVDGNLVSSRKPADLPAFNKALLETIAAARRPDSDDAAPATNGAGTTAVSPDADRQLFHHIEGLVAEEQALDQPTLSAAERQRLAAIRQELDKSWALLRQHRAEASAVTS